MQTETVLSVNLDLCTRCGICGKVCPSGIIQVGADGPVLTTPKACIRCGHCVAVCPVAALDHSRNPLQNQPELTAATLDPKTAEQFLRSRRSIRAYDPQPLAQDQLTRLLEIARFAPSGGNSQGLSYLVISDDTLMKKITATVIEWLEEQIRNEVAWVKPYAGMAKIYRQTGYDVVLRSAPHLVIALAAAKNPIGRDNTRYSLAYVELYAPSLGLGSCWAGFFEMAAFAGYKPLLDLLEIPGGKVITGAIMVGRPQYRYQRMVDRNPLEVSWRNHGGANDGSQ